MTGFDIILPVYQPVRDYLARAVASIEGQSYGNWCLYVIDDASPDYIIRWLMNRYGHHPRIESERLPKNRRAAGVRNHGAARGRGEIITFVDQDDFWHRDRLQIYDDFFQRHPDIQVIHSDIMWVDAEGNPIAGKADTENEIRRSIPYSEYRPRSLVTELFRHYSIRIGTLAVRRKAWEEVRGYNPRLFGGEDQDLVLRMASRFKMAHIPRALTYRRLHDQQVTRQYYRRRAWGQLRFYCRIVLQFPFLWPAALIKIPRSLKSLLMKNDGK